MREKTIKIGDVRGHLTVVGDLGKEAKNNRWICTCDCGSDKQVIKSSYQLNHNEPEKLHCGCNKQTRLGDRTSFLIGERYKNNTNSWYTIVGYPENCRRRDIEFDSGYKCSALVSQLKNGKVKDFNVKTYYGIASSGMKNATNHPLFGRWIAMIGRCYNPKHSQYGHYGAVGVKVSDELLNFSSYADIVSNLENYDKLLKNPDNWQIDKDKKSGIHKIYSRKTLSIIPSCENIYLSKKDDMIETRMYDDKNMLMAVFPSRCRAAMVMKLDRGNISRAIKTGNEYGGYFWRN